MIKKKIFLPLIPKGNGKIPLGRQGKRSLKGRAFSVKG